MREKASRTYREVSALRNVRYNDGAASRAYYAMYQAIVGVFESRGKEPEDFKSGGSEGRIKWGHDIVCQNAGQAGQLRGGGETRWALQLKGLRIKADYRPDRVDGGELNAILDLLPDFLRSMGVEIR